MLGLNLGKDLEKRLKANQARLGPEAQMRVQAAFAARSAPPQNIEDEANAYFQKIYESQISIEDVVVMLKGFKEYPTKTPEEWRETIKTFEVVRSFSFFRTVEEETKENGTAP